MKNNLKITHAKYVGDYKISIVFSDKKVNTVDYEPMVTSGHEEFSPYMDISKFKKFKTVDFGTAIAWGKDWDMILPLETLYSKKKMYVATHK